MAEESASTDAPSQTSVIELTFNIKSSGDSKHVVTVPETMTVLELKNKLSTAEYADVPSDRQRLIYSGRVLKDADPLSTYKIKDGNTVHMVKGAASSQRQTSASDTSSNQPSSAPAAGVPTNIATGTGNDPLAAITGARYAGYLPMPNPSQFGPDGGMGPPQSQEEMLRMLENPMFQSQMNEAMNNPQVIQMMQNMPQLRNQPWMRQMLENPEMRRMMMDPNVIRQSIEMSRMMGLGNQGGGSSMPAPGVTDSTPQPPAGADSSNPSATGNTTSQPPNPLAMFGNPGMGMGMGGQGGNPFSMLFGGGMGSTTPGNTSSTNATSDTSSTTGAPPPTTSTAGSPPPQQSQPNPMAAMAQQMMQNPEMMRSAMQMMGFGDGGNQEGGMGAGMGGAGPGAFNPFNPLATFGQQESAAAPQDTRPPEEQYADQLRQLNEMGFYEFERNVRALRMAGGSVQGAIEILFSGTI